MTDTIQEISNITQAFNEKWKQLDDFEAALDKWEQYLTENEAQIRSVEEQADQLSISSNYINQTMENLLDIYSGIEEQFEEYENKIGLNSEEDMPENDENTDQSLTEIRKQAETTFAELKSLNFIFSTNTPEIQKKILQYDEKLRNLKEKVNKLTHET